MLLLIQIWSVMTIKSNYKVYLRFFPKTLKFGSNEEAQKVFKNLQYTSITTFESTDTVNLSTVDSLFLESIY